MNHYNLSSFRALCGLRARKTGSADISGLGLVLCGHDAAILDRIEFQRSGVVDLFADSALVARFRLSESSIISLDEFRSVPGFAGASEFVGLGILDTTEFFSNAVVSESSFICGWSEYLDWVRPSGVPIDALAFESSQLLVNRLGGLSASAWGQIDGGLIASGCLDAPVADVGRCVVPVPIDEFVAMSDDNETDDLRLALCGPINVHFASYTPGIMVGDGFPFGSFPSMQAAARAIAYGVSSYDFPAGRGEYRVAGGGVIGYSWRSEGLHIFHATRDDISGREFFRSDDLALFGAANFAERGWLQADDFAWLCGSGVLDTVCSSAGFMWRCDSGSEPWRGDYMPIASRCGCLPLVSLPDDISGALLARSV